MNQLKRRTLLGLRLLTCAAIGCSAAGRERITVGIAPGAAGSGGATGTAGQALFDDGAGLGGRAGSGNSVGQTESPLTVHVEDLKSLTLEIVTLKCAGDCADVLAVARGGHAPYTFRWEDGSNLAQRHVCPKASMLLSVSATDTAIPNAEFPYAAQTAQAQVKADVLVCDAPGMPGKPCDKRASPGSFDPVVKWTWSGGYTMATPLVGNLTDDNGDGVIDLKDTPDIVLNDYASGALVILDGRTGTEHLRIPAAGGSSTPALGDIDGDHQIDIVALVSGTTCAAFRADGKELWRTSIIGTLPSLGLAAVSIADLDHDGSPEILVGATVLDAKGKRLWSGEAAGSPVAADLDGDGYLEVIAGAKAYRHDGTLYYQNADVSAAVNLYGAWTAVADVEGDDSPEIVVSTGKLFVLDHQGKTLHSVPNRGYPPAIHDVDGDGVPEILVSDGAKFTAYSGALNVRWSMPVRDVSGAAAGTAFDFLGDGSAEAMYGDETNSWGFDGSDGHVVFMQPRVSGTQVEYPTVADVDNDGSADILITSSDQSQQSKGLQVISDRLRRWIPARRIMNQDSYHVTNVNEDGSIPSHELPHWKLNNSFRAQAQIDANGVVCLPH
jgi:hypothetical protein